MPRIVSFLVCGPFRCFLAAAGTILFIPMSAFGSVVFWVDAVTDGIHRTDPDAPDSFDVGTPFLGGIGASCPDDPTPGNSCFQAPRDVAVDVAGGRLYWTDATDGAVRSANLNGSGIVTHTYSLNTWFLDGIRIDAGGAMMYFVDYGSVIGGFIFRVAFSDVLKVKLADPIDGGLQPIVSDQVGPRRIVLDVANGHLYWTNELTGKIQRADLDGSDVLSIHTGLDAPYALAIDLASQKIYWSENGPPKAIRRSDFNGTSVETLQSVGLGQVLDLEIELSAGRMLFSDGGRIRTAGLDPGDPITDLIAGLPGLNGIDIVSLAGVPALGPAGLVILGGAIMLACKANRSFKRRSSVPPGWE